MTPEEDERTGADGAAPVSMIRPSDQTSSAPDPAEPDDASPSRLTDREPPVREYRQHRFTRAPGSTELLIVRHGESAAVAAGRPIPSVDGQDDPALSSEGHEQAERVAERLADQQIDAIYVTPLQRTAQTAAPLAARLGLTPAVEPDLREVFLGDWEGGLFRPRMAEGDPIGLKMLAEERWDVIPNAEPEADFRARVQAGMRRVIDAHPDQRVAVFVHGGVIGEVLRHAVGGGRNFAFVGADNGSISHVVVLAERWALRRFNDTSHLSAGYDLPG